MIPVVLWGFIPLALLLYAVLRPRTAVLATFLIAVLVLPCFAYKMSVLPAYGKATAAAYLALVGTLIFHPQLIVQFRPRWVDLFPIAWTLWQFVPSLANGYGWYDGAAMALNHFLTWAVPFFVGRVYFTEPGHVRQLGIALVIGGLAYVLPCLFELKYSPCLHEKLYGFNQSSYAENFRLDGFRPVVFMTHGLMLGMWMCMTALIALWLMWNEKKLKICSLPVGAVALTLLITGIITKSTGAVGLLILGALTLIVTFRFRTKVALIVLIAITPTYIFLRYYDLWDPAVIGQAASMATGDSGREGSLAARTEQEIKVIAEVHQLPWTGWGNWGPGQDQLWLIIGRNTGLPGLALWIAYFSLPLAMTMTPAAWSRAPIRTYGIPIGCVCVLHVVDGLFNGMYNPMYVLAAGAVSGCCLKAAAVAQRTPVPRRSVRRIPPPVDAVKPMLNQPGVA